jgi:hypothetical protein
MCHASQSADTKAGEKLPSATSNKNKQTKLLKAVV